MERTTDPDNATYEIDCLAKQRRDAEFAVPGRYVLEPSIFDILKELDEEQGKQGQLPITDALNKLPHLYGVEINGKWFDTTEFADYHEALDYTQHHPIEFANCA